MLEDTVQRRIRISETQYHRNKNLVINDKIVATRTNMGKILLNDPETFKKYIKNLPKEYLREEPNLEKQTIAELDDTTKEEYDEYQDVEKQYIRRERSRAQFSGTTRPKRLPKQFQPKRRGRR